MSTVRVSRFISSLLFLLMIPAASAHEPGPITKAGDGPDRILVLDGSPVHDVGNLRVHASNWGAIGSQPGSASSFSNAPSAEWPAGSRVEYLYVGGLWVGALTSGVPSVVTAAFQSEFRPSGDVRDIVYRSAFGALGGARIPSVNADDDHDGTIDEDPLDGFDNDLDGQVDEDYAGISKQMFSRRMRDDDPASLQIYPQHLPMHLSIREESYQFSQADYDDFVGFTFFIKNDGAQMLEDVYVGVFADGDVGQRDTPNYWEDDATAYVPNLVINHGSHGSQAYDFAYWYDVNGDGGQAAGYCGIVILDHPVDPTGAAAPVEVGVSTFARFQGAASYENGGDPTNDFERYELMSTRLIESNSAAPQDQRTLVAVGPFAEIAPGQTIQFSFALVVTPRNDFTNVEHAATAYHGLWFDLDGNPGTGIDGKEHQEHWFLPNDFVSVAITDFNARPTDASSVTLDWQTRADETISSFELFRATGSGELRSIDRSIPGDRRHYVDDGVEPGMHYEYQLLAHGAAGGGDVSQRIGVTVPAAVLALGQNAPNPFRSSTSISIELPERTAIELAVFDVAGRRVATIASGERGAGTHDFAWNGAGQDGRVVGAGIYFYRLKAGNRTLTRKLLLVR